MQERTKFTEILIQLTAKSLILLRGCLQEISFWAK